MRLVFTSLLKELGGMPKFGFACSFLLHLKFNLLLPFFVNFIITCRDGELPLIVAIDLQPMAPIEGVIQVQGDITNARTAEVVRTSFFF